MSPALINASNGSIPVIAPNAGYIATRGSIATNPKGAADVIAMPIGQGHEHYGRYANKRGVNPIQILAPEIQTGTGILASSATRVRLIPTGKHARLISTGGTSRQLGRDIVRTTGAADAGSGHSSRLRSIPITVEPS